MGDIIDLYEKIQDLTERIETIEEELFKDDDIEKDNDDEVI